MDASLLSPEELDWCASPSLSASAAEQLAEAVIGLAIDEFNQLTAAGAVVNGKINQEFLKPDRRLRRRVARNYVTELDIKELFSFFTDGHCARWLEFGGFKKINADAIRKKLGL